MKKTILVALIGTAMAAAIAATGCSASARIDGNPSSPPGTDQLPKGVLAVIPIMGSPLGLGAGFGSVWVTSENGNVLYRIDPATNKVVAQIDVGQAMCGTPAFGFGRVWVPDCNFGPHGLVVVDPATNHVVRTLADQVAGSVGIGAGSVWAGPRIDPATLSEQPLLRTGHDDLAITFGDGSVWVSDAVCSCSKLRHHQVSVSRIDPATGKVIATIKAGVRSIQNWAMFAGGKLWIYPWLQSSAVGDKSGNKIWRIDPRTNTATELTLADIHVTSLNTSVTAGMGSLWLRGEAAPRLVNNTLVVQDNIYRLNPRTLKITGKYPAASASWGFMTTGFGSLWIANFTTDTVWRDQVTG